jgi:phosphoenolpyruvate-protein phosphotransferase (PTS system enzyme I)
MSNSVRLEGTPASHGIGIGSAWILEERKLDVNPETIAEEEIGTELQKFENAFDLIDHEFQELKAKADNEVAAIIEAQIQMVHDPELRRSILHKIEDERYEAAYAIFSTMNEYIHILENAEAAWVNHRTIDMVSIRDQLIDAAKERNRRTLAEKGSVVFATEVSPTQMIELSHNEISGIVMQKGGLTSHSVILAQSLDIPCIIGARWRQAQLRKRDKVVIDGDSGVIIVNPEKGDEERYLEKKKRQQLKAREDLKVANKPHETACGSEFTLRANVEFLEELPKIETHGAKGVGLLRTETILFQESGVEIDTQLEFYRTVMQSTGSDTVTIRLFDAGGDKLLENSDTESNPFLGWRGIRMLLDRCDLLETQLEAICRLSGEFPGRVNILVPMISSAREIIELKKVIRQIQEKLKSESVPFDENLPVGVMIEVPSAALMASQIAKETDFFSIGTNDLTQYTLAVDRGNEKISALYEPYHPAVWKLIRLTKEGADAENIPVAVCGEIASKPEAAACLVGMGIRELSMTTTALPKVKALLCRHTLNEMKKLADVVNCADSPEEVSELLNAFGRG